MYKSSLIYFILSTSLLYKLLHDQLLNITTFSDSGINHGHAEQTRVLRVIPLLSSDFQLAALPQARILILDLTSGPQAGNIILSRFSYLHLLFFPFPPVLNLATWTIVYYSDIICLTVLSNASDSVRLQKDRLSFSDFKALELETQIQWQPDNKTLWYHDVHA